MKKISLGKFGGGILSLKRVYIHRFLNNSKYFQWFFAKSHRRYFAHHAQQHSPRRSNALSTGKPKKSGTFSKHSSA